MFCPQQHRRQQKRSRVTQERLTARMLRHVRHVREMRPACPPVAHRRAGVPPSRPSSDGAARRAPFTVTYDGRLYPLVTDRFSVCHIRAETRHQVSCRFLPGNSSHGSDRRYQLGS
jgi:hypothetical protein